jgi:transcription factor 1
VTQVLAEAEILLESEHLSPHEHHFWPYQHSAGGRLPRTQNPDISKENKTGSLLAYGQCLLKIEPRADVLLQPQEVEPFEYIVRNLFVKRASSIKSQLAHLAPGAVKLLDVMRDDHPALAALGPVDINPDTLICDMTHTQFIALSKIFERWPFKPRSYFEVSQS